MNEFKEVFTDSDSFEKFTELPNTEIQKITGTNNEN